MRTWLLERRPGADALTLVERPPSALGPHEVRVRMRAVALNYRDLLVRKRAASGELPRPTVPCSDGAGEVADVGASVTRFAVGARVAANFFP